MIIAIDGLDGSGKETTCNALRRMIVDQYNLPECSVVVHSFPDYNTPSGREIKKVLADSVLQGMDGRSKAYMVATLFAINRAEHFASLKNPAMMFDPSYIHIFDRYWASNIVYQGLGRSGEEMLGFVQNCKAIDNVFFNPMPTVYYFLRVPFSILNERLSARTESKSGVEDTYEKTMFQMAVYHLSEYVLSHNNIYNIYDAIINTAPCVNGMYEQKTVGQITAELFDAAAEHLKQAVSTK